MHSKLSILILLFIGIISCHAPTKDLGFYSETLQVEQLSANTFLHRSFLATESYGKVPCNGMLVIDHGEALIFDTPVNNRDAEALINWVENTLKCKVKGVVATHFHNDCLGGLKAFHNRGIPSYASEETIRFAKIDSVEQPQYGFSNQLKIEVGHTFVSNVFVGEGHTKDNIISYYPQDKVLFGGCLVKELGASKGYIGDANINEWSNTVRKLKSRCIDTKIVIPGHGKPGGKELLDYTIDLFKPSNPNIETLDYKLDSLYRQGIFNGFAVAIVDETGAIYNKGFGVADVKTQKKYTENTIINIASISKMFIGVALLQAQEQGLLKLDDPINKYLPFEVKHPKYSDEKISIKHLATHTSAIIDNDMYMNHAYINKNDSPLQDSLQEKYGSYYANASDKWMPLSDFLQKIVVADEEWYDKTLFSDNKPGAHFEYSNVGASLCALVIENASGKSFASFTRENIFEALGMSSTGWFFEEMDTSRYSTLYADDLELPYYRNLSYPDGDLKTTSSDLSLFLSEMIKGSQQKGILLTNQSYHQLFRSQLDEKQLAGKENFNVGYFTEKHLLYDVIGHSGGDPGTNTLMFFNNKTKMGRIMILNSDSEKSNSDAVYWAIWNALGKFGEKANALKP